MKVGHKFCYLSLFACGMTQLESPFYKFSISNLFKFQILVILYIVK